VVAGIRTPLKIEQLAQDMPEVYAEFAAIAQRLEQHYRDVQDLEFTVEKGKLYMLQTRSAKRTAAAAVKIAVDMQADGLITKEEAVQRVEPGQVVQLLLPRFDPQAKADAEAAGRFLAKGLNASPGAAYGKAVFDADTAEAQVKADASARVVLVRPETSPDDVHGMLVAKGILTARGGATSHAAVVARGLGLPCVAGTEDIRVDEEGKFLTVIKTGQTLREGDDISIDGSTGEVFAGIIPVVEPNYDEETDLRTILGWADDIRRLGVWANADIPADAERAVKYGAEGIGLCRTEHMFFEKTRLPVVRRMILAPTLSERQAALDELLPIQQADFAGLFRAMRDPQSGEAYPVVIRLIDPPLHEFLPSYEELLVEVTHLEDAGNAPEELAEKRALLQAVAAMREANPMLGLRGCRLGLLYPEINVMQTRAILGAAVDVAAEGISAKPKIMIPLVGFVTELAEVRRQLEAAAADVVQSSGKTVDYKFGTMIELPRAALTAGQIAGVAEFFSFGTNDLTQTTLGMSRDDAEGKFLLRYVDGLPKLDVNGTPFKDADGKAELVKILKVNPFQTIDREGVGRLVEIAVREGRATNAELEVGVCGEHGGDPESVAFFESVGLDYVSCSPFRVPVARLAAAQAKLAGEVRDK
ncbi:MAG: pyruvate, phosphate dikinase, partial [Ktedonobacterales bacterium]|nr:pyruvate, phosphate dikinase [Ktedonobacterales bacterium]